jgi:metal-responsive CopG/Arc/MetJ family transcriptional regulator
MTAHVTFLPYLDSQYNLGYTLGMKTAISLPDQLFHEAEQFAQERGLSRSELYARALALYLQTQRQQTITETLNQVYDQETSTLDPGIRAAQTNILPKEAW